jgi:hypothetical protein
MGSITRKSECITAVIVFGAAKDGVVDHGAINATDIAIAQSFNADAERRQRKLWNIRSLLTRY